MSESEWMLFFTAVMAISTVGIMVATFWLVVVAKRAREWLKNQSMLNAKIDKSNELALAYIYQLRYVIERITIVLGKFSDAKIKPISFETDEELSENVSKLDKEIHEITKTLNNISATLDDHLKK